MKKKALSMALGLTMAASSLTGFAPVASAAAKTPQYQQTPRLMEELNRGLIAVYRTVDNRSVLAGEGGVYLSWRLLGTESLTNQAFDIYRNGTKIKTTGVHDATNYIDTAGKTTDTYKVVPAGASAEAVAAEPAVTPAPNYTAKGSEVGNGNSEKNSFTYMDIPIVRPDPVERMGDGKKSYYYSYTDSAGTTKEGGANDASVGDLDGDGDYEIVLKWDPTDSKDSAGADFTGNVYIDAYEIDPNNGGYKWRIDLGKNVTAGAHYTQFMVYDFDGDGKAEVAMKTAPGSKDGLGNYVSAVGDTEAIRNVDNEAVFIGLEGRLKGKNPFTQYLTIFDGETGAALYTTEYIPFEGHGNWGDDGAKYNRSERYLAGVAYLDGVHPSLIMCRGYYDHAVIRAYNWDGSSLNMLWEHNANDNTSSTMYGQGNHNLSIGDIDNDGFDEIVYGSASLDHDGKKVLGNTRLGHGDAMHLNDFNNDGMLEVFSVKEDSGGYKKFAEDLRVAATGKHFWAEGKLASSGDNGRGLMDNLDDAYAKTHPNAMAIGYSSSFANAHDLNGDDLKAKPTAGSRGLDNFLVFWDGDLGRELLDDNIIAKYYAESGSTKRFYASSGYSLEGGSSNNYTKKNPSLCADIWGDWREEVIMPVGKGLEADGVTPSTPYLRIYTSTIPTDYRLTTLMHDSQYRMSVAWQNVGYNQPTHTSYYVGSAALATDSNGNELNYLAPAIPFTNVVTSLDPVAVTGIDMPQSSVTVERGSTVSLNASVVPANATKKGINYESADPSIATVANGIVTGVKEGKTTITATTKDGGFSAKCEVTVYMNHVTGITLSNKTLELGTGDVKAITANIAPSDATDKSVTWKSSNSSVASVDANGNVEAISQGTATITATTTDGNYSAECTVTVFPLITTDMTGTNVFVTSNTDSTSTLTSDAVSATFVQKGAPSGEFHKDFTPYKDNKATISFMLNTGSSKDANNAWNWTGREYTIAAKLLDADGNNILTISQAFTTKAQDTLAQIGTGAAESISGKWTKTVADGENPIARSSTRWVITLDLDYDKGIVNAKLQGRTSGGELGIAYEKSFDLNGASFKTLQFTTTQNGTGLIDVSPTVTDVSYKRTEKQSSVVGTTNILYNKGTSADTAWSQADIADWTLTNADAVPLQYDGTVGNGRIFYNPTKPGVPYSAEKTFDVSKDSTVTYSADWHFGKAVNRAANKEYIQFGSNLRVVWTQGYGMYVSTDGGATYPFTLSEDDNRVIADNSNAIFTGSNEAYTKNITVTVDTATNEIKAFKLDGASVDKYVGTVLPDGTTYGSVKFGFDRNGATDNWEYPTGLDSLMVSEFVEGEAPTPTTNPTTNPTTEPTAIPTAKPTTEPTAIPTTAPTEAPSTPAITLVNIDANTVNVTMDAVKDGEMYVIGSVYDAQGRLVEVKLVGVKDAVKGTKTNASFEFTTDLTSANTVKVSAWDALTGMKPLYDSLTIAPATLSEYGTDVIELESEGEIEEFNM